MDGNGGKMTEEKAMEIIKLANITYDEFVLLMEFAISYVEQCEPSADNNTVDKARSIVKILS